MIKKHLIYTVLAAVLIMFCSCKSNTNTILITAAYYCDKGNVEVPFAMNYLTSVDGPSAGNVVFRSAQEMIDAGVYAEIIDQVDFNTEMVIGFIYGCSSGCSPRGPMPLCAGTDCESVIVNYYQPPYTGPSGPGTVTCMAYWCNNSFMKVKKSSLPVVFNQVTLDHDQDGDGASDYAERCNGTDAWDPASRP